MIKFHIPDFYFLNQLNRTLIDLINESPNLFYDNISIGSIYGTFSNAIWNGGRISTGRYISRNNILNTIEEFNKRNVPLRYTFTNSQVTDIHFNDEYCNEILKLSNNGFNEIMVNNLALEEYLRKNYPNFKYILSTTAAIRGIDNINKACEKYDMIVIDYNDNRDIELLDKIENKDKIEILINETCPPNCQFRKYHYDLISQIQINPDLDKDRTGFQCPNDKSDLTNINEEELYGIYSEMGFSNFKIRGRMNPPKLVTEYYVKYLVKPEYKDNVREMLWYSVCLF